MLVGAGRFVAPKWEPRDDDEDTDDDEEPFRTSGELDEAVEMAEGEGARPCTGDDDDTC